MLPDWAPNAHPLIIHFPIALFIAAFVADLVQLLRKADDGVATALYFFAGLSALAAFLTGRSGADAMMIPAHVVSALNDHADWGLRTVWLLGAIAVARVIAWRLVRTWRPAIRIPLLVLGAAGLFVVFETAEHGGRLVFEHGLGTAAGMAAEMAPPPPPTEAGDQLEGAWTWTPHAGLATLLRDAQFSPRADGAPAHIEFRDGETVLAVQGPATLLIADSTRGVQVDVRINKNSASGRVEIIHNATGTDAYHFFRVDPDGRIQQGLVNAGRESILSTGSFPSGDWHTVRVVGEGTHYRSYVDGTRVTHGHGDAAPEGRVGIRVEGGSVLISSMSVVPIE